ncbi:MAG: 5-dehydro-4-deoxyglucarate dehydratase [Vicinamibacteraceae bacterium]
MTPNALKEQLTGVIAFPVTPFLADGSLDVDGLRRNVQALAPHPFCGLVAAGGTGELYSLSELEHRQVVETCAQAVADRMPVIAGVGGSVRLACDQARHAAAAGAAGILALPPYYPDADEAGLLDYYRSIGASTTRGLLVYSRDWVNPGPAFVERLATIPTLIAWKDGQGNVRRYQIIISSVGDRLHWIGGAGDDLVPAYYRLGIRTYTSSISNVAPRLSIALHETAAAGDETALQQLMTRYVIPLYAFRARRKGYEVAVMKAMMTLLGSAAGPVRPPLVDVSDAEREELAQMLAGWKAYL